MHLELTVYFLYPRMLYEYESFYVYWNFVCTHCNAFNDKIDT